ncbi:ABC transporter substrate-binding protein [Comamonas thiooxydans]|uniref:ABC transporter substrate-binding protein n=1 Tax=Comamonas thiooxydans TaxID=363952 RepID=UPI00050FA9AF|nr:ABC transporter substrate-binding protein [Comamonas thiooxydans]KGG91403.1 ABC transporter substrate-binding protein [Comamonas thiooxydans]KGG97016.1 ABC transporter substrate-binding protein [Comamonas thiooxydans]KGH05537.1 ABC transporter substrate-binding protein [Comamonas thiooxydans]KGH13403.1 ABC transporter substrate-binding protein [Comamonas thiooxydans]TZG11548.1 ABC transporter substrate-binding protein [Comamonas thiooxydans]
MQTPSRCAWLLAASITTSLTLHAQENKLTIGASLPLSGSQAEAGKEGMSIMQAQVEAFNKQGGLGGKALTLKVLDDGYEPQRAASNARQLIQEGALALLNCWGTASCTAMQPEVQQGQTALVGVIAGAGSMRQQPGRFIYPLRASTQAEVAAMLQQMQTIGLRRIAIVHQNDGFGKNSLQIALNAFAANDLKAAATLAVEASGSNTPDLARQLAALPDLQGVIVLAGAPATIGLITMARQAHVTAPFYNLAAQANRAVVQGLGPYTRGIAFTTLVPSPWKGAVPAIKDYQQLLDHGGMPPASYLGLEVFLNTRTLLDALRKAAPTSNRAGLLAALDAMGEIRYGAMHLRFTPPRTGSSYVGLTMIDASGHFRE